MGLIAKETGGSKYPPVPQDLHHAICYAVYDLGTHPFEYQGRAKIAHKLVIIFELPEIRIDIERDGESKNLPRAISKQYTLSLHEKSKLRKDLQGWRGKVFTPEELEGFDIGKLLGVNCLIQVLHNTKDGKTYANISSIMPLPKGFEKRTAENPIKFFSFEEDGKEIPEGTPEWIEKLIKESQEWKGESTGASEHTPEDNPPPPDDDDIPF
jgi:hypothetical protein